MEGKKSLNISTFKGLAPLTRLTKLRVEKTELSPELCFPNASSWFSGDEHVSCITGAPAGFLPFDFALVSVDWLFRGGIGGGGKESSFSPLPLRSLLVLLRRGCGLRPLC